MPKNQQCEEGCMGMTDKMNKKADEIYIDINKKVSTWTFGVFVTVFIFVMGGAYIYTAISNASSARAIEQAENRQQAQNASQDKVISDMMQLVIQARDAAISAKDEMKAHREFTEGKRK